MELSPLNWQVHHTAVLPAEPLMCGQQSHSGADPTEKPLHHSLGWCMLLSRWPLCHRGRTFCFAACLLCVRTTSSDLKTVPSPHSPRVPDSVWGKILCTPTFVKGITKPSKLAGTCNPSFSLVPLFIPKFSLSLKTSVRLDVTLLYQPSFTSIPSDFVFLSSFSPCWDNAQPTTHNWTVVGLIWAHGFREIQFIMRTGTAFRETQSLPVGP